MTVDAQVRNEVYLVPHLSYSQLSSMQTCSWRWVLEKGFHVPQRPTWATVGGSAVHSASEVWDNWTLAGEFEQGDAALDQLWRDEFQKAMDDRLEREPDFPIEDWRATGRSSRAWPDKENRAWWDFHGPAMLRSWVTWRLNTTWEIAMLPGPGGEAVPGIEVECNPTLGGVVTKQFIDRVLTNKEGTELLVLDLKSGSREPESADQLGGYAAGLEAVYGVSPTWGTYWMARTGGTGVMHDMRMYPRERVDHMYRVTRQQQEEGLFLPKVGPLCPSCSARDYCLAVNGKHSDLIPTPWETKVVNKSTDSLD